MRNNGWALLLCFGLSLVSICANAAEIRDFNEEQYRKATEGLHYVEKSEKPKSNVEFKLPEKAKDEGIYLGKGQIVLIVLLGIGLIALIILVIRNVPPPNPDAAGQDAWFSGILESEGGPADALQKAIDEALTARNFNLALRLRYLQTIALLHQKSWIHWKKDKTNAAYVRELAAHHDAGAFRKITLDYEYFWFGKQKLDEENYHSLSEQSLQFMDEIKEGRR